MTHRVLVVDDDPRILNTLDRGLRLEGYEVETATSGYAALTRLRQGTVDLVVLDILMPGLDGFEVCRLIREIDDVPILMLTARDEVRDRVTGLDAGADDYLVKPFSLEELAARLRALLRRKGTGGAPLRFADLSMDPDTRDVRRGETKIELTAREFELLEAFMTNPRRVLTRAVLLRDVWGFDFEIGSNTLEVYVGYLRRKLEANGEPRLIHTVRGVGYVLRD